MYRQMILFAAGVFAAGSALAGDIKSPTTSDTGVTVTTKVNHRTVGLVEGDGLESATTQATETLTPQSYSSDRTTVTDDYARNFDAQGNPTFLGDYSFRLD